jgi:hypothetical protein
MIRIYPFFERRFILTRGDEPRTFPPIYGRRPFIAFKETDDEAYNLFPTQERHSTFWADLMTSPTNRDLPCFLPPDISSVPLRIRRAYAASCYPGYWRLEGKEELYYEHYCCENDIVPRTIFMYELTTQEHSILISRTLDNANFKRRNQIYQYLNENWINPSQMPGTTPSTSPPSDPEATPEQVITPCHPAQNWGRDLSSYVEFEDPENYYFHSPWPVDVDTEEIETDDSDWMNDSDMESIDNGVAIV